MNNSSSINPTKKWIRGVNLGGWLVLERYIVPYQFAITDCHIVGDFCWYDGALSAPSTNDPIYKECDMEKCKPLRSVSLYDKPDYPLDEWHLAAAFPDKKIGEKWLNYHFENFIQKEDLVRMKEAGLTHLRVPLPHFILGDVRHGEPWIAGKRWMYFVRMCKWARQVGLEVWPNIHTAPGSQNGFDNSGLQKKEYTCAGWNDHAEHVQRTLKDLNDITAKITSAGLTDVVTGFGLLNEPFGDCDKGLYMSFMDKGFDIVRKNLGPDVGIYVSDMFTSKIFNDGSWWLDEKHSNTYLDTHFYHVFSEAAREFSTKQHIAHVCYPDDIQNALTDCCFEDAPVNTVSSNGVQRISTEWSAAFDIMPGSLIVQIMDGIAENGVAPAFNRTLSPARQIFMRNFVQSQIVAYEAADAGVGQGWFFWTIKTEGGAFAEWDFSRGLQDAWIPPIVDVSQPSESVYGTCEQILERTENRTDVHSDAYALWKEVWELEAEKNTTETWNDATESLIGPENPMFNWICTAAAVLLFIVVLNTILRRRKWQYTPIAETSMKV